MANQTKDQTKVAKERPMRVTGRKYAGVSDMVQETTGAEFAEEFETHQAARELVNCLTVIRCVNGVSQVDLAVRMGCAQSKVSKLESSVDADLNFGDVLGYAAALKQGVHMVISPMRKNGADHIRFHIACIKRELDQLVTVAGDDPVIGDGVGAFAVEQAQRMVTMVEETLDKLPNRVEQSAGGISIEAEGNRGERLAVDGAKRPRRAARRAALAE